LSGTPSLSDSIFRDSNGKIIGKNFANNCEYSDTFGNLDSNCPAFDSQSEHGSFVSEVIAMKTDPDTNLKGICENCKIMPLGVYNASSPWLVGGTIDRTINAINYAVLNGADIINMSLGGSFDSISQNNAVQNAIASGVFVVASSSNCGRDGNPEYLSASGCYNANNCFQNPICYTGNYDAVALFQNNCLEADGLMYPASYDNVISVSGFDPDGINRIFTANNKVSISAPASHILIPAPVGYNHCYNNEETYSLFNLCGVTGTSFSSPIVAAIIGLAKSVDPSITPATYGIQQLGRGAKQFVYTENPTLVGKMGVGAIDACGAIASCILDVQSSQSNSSSSSLQSTISSINNYPAQFGCISKVSATSNDISGCQLRSVDSAVSSIACNNNSPVLSDYINCSIELEPGRKYFLNDLSGQFYSDSSQYSIGLYKFIQKPGYFSEGYFYHPVVSTSGLDCNFVNDIKIVCNNIPTNIGVTNDICVNDVSCNYGEFEFGIKHFNRYDAEYKNAKNVKINIFKTRPMSSGGAITIGAQSNIQTGNSISQVISSVSSLSTSVSSLPSAINKILQPLPTQLVLTNNKNVITNSSDRLKSKLSISDPYICGVGSYGNVPNPKEFGVEHVIYDFYKQGSNKASYKFKLKLNSNGDFFLPISQSTNIISDGEYRVVYSAIDIEGNKAQGEYTDYITNDCSGSKLTSWSMIRTGGLQNERLIIVGLFLFWIIVLLGSSFKKKSLQNFKK
jgi:Subtilase family